MKALIALASLALIVTPVHGNTVALLEQYNFIIKTAMKAARAEDWEMACIKYTEGHQFRMKHNLHAMKAVVGSVKQRQLTHKRNWLTVKANREVNYHGSNLCINKAGMPWKRLNLVTEVNVPSPSSSSVRNTIRTHCEIKWKEDYRIKYCIDRDTAAAESLGY